MQQLQTNRRGVAAVLAMLFLVLFAALALGFYAATNVSTQVVQNDSTAAEALLAAESGLNFMTYRLSQAHLPLNTSDSTQQEDLYNELAAALNGTLNMKGRTVGFDGTTISVPASASDFIPLTSTGESFRSEITQTGSRMRVKVTGRDSRGAMTRVLQLEYNRAPRDGIFSYAVASKGQIVTGGSSRVTGSPDSTIADFLSASKTDAYPVVVGGSLIGGDVSIVKKDGFVDHQSGSIGGASDKAEAAKHIHIGVPEPEFPTINYSVYTQYVTNLYDPAGTGPPLPGPIASRLRGRWNSNWLAEAGEPVAVMALAALTPGRSLGDELASRALANSSERLANVYITSMMRRSRVSPLNMARMAYAVRSTQKSRSAFAMAKKPDDLGGGRGGGGGSGDGGGGGGVVLSGIYRNCYVPAGANPNFTSKDVIEGVLYIAAGNDVKFAGGTTIRGVIIVEKPAAASATLPTTLDFRGNVNAYGVETLDAATFGDLRNKTGLFLLAEGAAVDFRGNFDQTLSGSIIASKISFGGSAGGTIKGSIIGMDPAHPLELKNSTSSPLYFIKTAAASPPAGSQFTSYFKPDAASYREGE